VVVCPSLSESKQKRLILAFGLDQARGQVNEIWKSAKIQEANIEGQSKRANIIRTIESVMTIGYASLLYGAVLTFLQPNRM
jgi:hypothetical protein